MRMRKKKDLEKRLVSCRDYIIENPKEHRGRFMELFSKKRPLYLEIGAGRGSFSRKMCQSPQRDFNYIAMERCPHSLINGIEAAKAENIEDLFYIIDDASILPEIFSKGEADRIFLNFCDPWPKNRHTKRRLTHQRFLEQYREILSRDGQIEFKTDNMGLFEFSVGEFSKSGFILKDVSLDLHNSVYSQDNLTTEYEDRFSSMGMPIYRCVAAPGRQE